MIFGKVIFTIGIKEGRKKIREEGKENGKNIGRDGGERENIGGEGSEERRGKP